MTPLAIDLFCGLGGWTEGLLAEGYYVVGFDIERHRYPKRMLPELGDDGSKKMSGKDRHGNTLMNRALEQVHGFHRAPIIADEWTEYPAQLVIQDVLTLHGSQFKDAALIVASPPCQAYSYRAMPWKRAKALPPPDNTLFETCFRIQREACEAAGRHVPLIVENVRGAQKWVGRPRWNYGSFYLWGDVPALMPLTMKRKMAGFNFNKGNPNVWGPNHVSPNSNRFAELVGQKNPSFRFDGSGRSFQTANVEGTKGIPHRTKGHWTNPAEHEGVKCGGDWFNAEQPSISRLTSSKSSARKFASAMIAKIPLPLSRHIAATFKPQGKAA